MIRADEKLGIASFALADACSTVAAGIVEGTDTVVPVANNDDRVVTYLPRHPVARAGNLAIVARIEPMPPPDPVNICVEDLRGQVELAFERTTTGVSLLERLDVLRSITVAPHPHCQSPLRFLSVRPSLWDHPAPRVARGHQQYQRRSVSRAPDDESCNLMSGIHAQD